MLTKSQIETFLFNWVKTNTGFPDDHVIFANQKAPRPSRPYASINFTNPADRVGMTIDQQSMTDTVDGMGHHTYTVATEGMRKAVASINIFGENAVDTLSRLRDSLDHPDVIESFGAIGITHLDDGQISDLTALQETEYEERGQFDLTIAYVAGVETDVGTIETVTIDGTANGRDVPTEVVTST